MIAGCDEREKALPPRWRVEEQAEAGAEAGQERRRIPAGGRKVLGVLHSNRGLGTSSKQVSSTQGFVWSNDENSGQIPTAKLAAKPSFTIHVDESYGVDEPDGNLKRSKIRDVECVASLELNPTVLSLGTRQPLAPIECPTDVSFDSPMLLDTSISGSEEKQARVNAVPEYADDIHKYLREMELKCRPKAGYMKKQPDITNSMRAILIDWLVEVGEEYKLQNETLYLAVNYIDRFLSSMSVLRGKLQLVGTAAMLLASKFEEIYPPEVAEFVYITDDTYTKKQVLRMEHLILKVLSFDLAAPTINQFLGQYCGREETSSKVVSLSLYLGELSLIDSEPYLKYLPSAIAASIFCLANYTINKVSWPRSLVQLTGYTLESIMPCVNDLYQTYLKASEHAQQAVREKYKTSKYHCASLIDPLPSLDQLL